MTSPPQDGAPEPGPSPSGQPRSSSRTHKRPPAPGEARAFLGVGSNIRPEENVPAALDFLSGEVTLTGISTFYRTLPVGWPRTSTVGGTTALPFLNGVLEIHTSLSSSALESLLGRVEEALGRVRELDRDAPRPMDLDLLLYLPGDPEEEIRPPHSDVFARAFVALPLFELDPDLLLPPD